MAQSQLIPGAYHAPPRTQNAQGLPRRVGVEVELGGLSLERTVEVMQAVLGESADIPSTTEATLETESFGTFKVELDSATLKDRTYLKPLEALGLDTDSEASQRIEDTVLRVARTVVPMEVVTPPIAWNRLAELDPLWHALRDAGAEGTSSSLLNAYGLHFNPEPPDFDIVTVSSVVRSFLMLEDWIIESARTDLSRRIAPFVQSFPEAYRRHVLRSSLTPTWDELVRDYLEHNPTRNRSLDLLPLMVHLGANADDSMAQRVENWSLVKGRPTYHYRLPDCLISEPGWSPAVEWNRWVVVERLAESRELLEELSSAYLATSDLPLRLQSMSWISHLRGTLAPLVEDAAFSRR